MLEYVHEFERVDIGTLARGLEVLGTLTGLPSLDARVAEVLLTAGALFALHNDVLAETAVQDLNELRLAKSTLSFQRQHTASFVQRVLQMDHGPVVKNIQRTPFQRLADGLRNLLDYET